MTFGYTCDAALSADCSGAYLDEGPPFSFDVPEWWVKTSQYGDDVKQYGYTPGTKVTICEECFVALLDAVEWATPADS